MTTNNDFTPEPEQIAFLLFHALPAVMDQLSELMEQWSASTEPRVKVETLPCAVVTGTTPGLFMRFRLQAEIGMDVRLREGIQAGTLELAEAIHYIEEQETPPEWLKDVLPNA